MRKIFHCQDRCILLLVSFQSVKQIGEDEALDMQKVPSLNKAGEDILSIYRMTLSFCEARYNSGLQIPDVSKSLHIA